MQGIAQSIVNNLEISCGVGLGLQGSSELIEGMEIGLGVSYDLVNISLVDGQISVLQKSSNGASLSLAFIDILSPDIQYRNMPWDKNGNAWYIDTSRDAFTIYEYSIYLYAGFSFSIGFDFISFVKAVADTFN